MALVSRILGLQLTVLIAGWVLISSSNQLGMFIDIPSLITVYGVAFGLMLICYTPSQLLTALRALLNAAASHPDPDCRNAEAVFGRAYQAVWGMGIIATLFGFIVMLADLSDPSAIGGGMAVAILAVAYAAIGAELFIAPCRQLLLNQVPKSPAGESQASDQHEDTRPGMGLYRGAMVVMIMITTFVVMILAFSELVDYTDSYQSVIEQLKEDPEYDGWFEIDESPRN